MNMNLSKLQETVEDRGAWHDTDLGVAKIWTHLNTEYNNIDFRGVFPQFYITIRMGEGCWCRTVFLVLHLGLH